MPVAEKIQGFIQRASWIREMFEAGDRLRAEVGPENVFDFSLGNPDVEPPVEFKNILQELAADKTPGLHGYMSNAGLPETRSAVAEYLSDEFGLNFSSDDVIMSVGAGGGLNVALKTILNPGDEVIVSSPYFVEYNFYIDNHGGEIKVVDTNPDFTLNLKNIEAAFTGKTRAVLINSPNNPTGVIYPEENIRDLSALLEGISSKVGRPVFLISDEPYRKIIYDGVVVPSVFAHYKHVISVTSYSKDLSLPGERIGFLAIHPEVPEKNLLLGGLILNTRIIGYVNAPVLMQRAVARLQGKSVDIGIYKRRRDIFVKGLKECDYDLIEPQGAFYLFPRSPIEDDVAFTREMQKENILVVPGSGFGKPGYFRLAYCVDEKMIEKALPGFKRVRERLK
ncbi:MAG: pyridoxal phosphate-dependent aminotransferase [Deltaproteobacteria bacterium]|nr:pyridoxal phosphate-dependent aminotransferase [Deltaproteobacteria bacterium]MBW2052916.1 pyridoxal phosphate-dependent aminotransferase [Deltaproteobacteria bacterium]MBW2323778.1 pyridoxal phosphate-dependent aminotransferase [Deltaproteobacteria bacterium]